MQIISRWSLVSWRPLLSAGMGSVSLTYLLAAGQQWRTRGPLQRVRAEERLAHAAVWGGGGLTLWLTQRVVPTLALVGPAWVVAKTLLPRGVTFSAEEIRRAPTPKTVLLNTREIKQFLEWQDRNSLANLTGYPAWQMAVAMRRFAQALGPEGGPKELQKLRAAAVEMTVYAEEAERQLGLICDEIEARLELLRQIVEPVAKASREATREQDQCTSAEFIRSNLFDPKKSLYHFDWVREESRFPRKPERVSHYLTYARPLKNFLPSLCEKVFLDPTLHWEGEAGLQQLFDSAAQWRLQLSKRFPQHDLPALVEVAIRSLQ